MKSLRGLWLACIAGALVPLFWFVLGMMLFTLPEGPASRLFWRLVYITCPFWNVPNALLTSILNAALYGFFYLLAMAVYDLLRRRGKSQRVNDVISHPGSER